MNSVEGSRIINVLEQAVLHLSWLSTINESNLEAEIFEGVLSDDVTDHLEQHRHAVSGTRDISADHLARSTADLLRLIAASTESQAELDNLDIQPSHAVQEAIELFERLKGIMIRRVYTTVEEDRSNKEHFAEVCDREERASKESTSLHQQLRMERAERDRALEDVRRKESTLRADLQAVEDKYQASMSKTRHETSTQRQVDQEAYDRGKADLEKDVATLTRRLAELRENNANADAQIRQRKNQNQMTLQDWLRDYDATMFEREAEYQEQKTAYEKVRMELLEKESQIELWRHQRLKHEDEERARKIKELTQRSKERQIERAAVAIQQAWKNFQTSKKKKKGKGGKKKK